MGENDSTASGMSRRTVMFGAAVIATAMAGVTPLGSAFTVDTTGDGIADALEIGAENKHAHNLAKTMASIYGGQWLVDMDGNHTYVTVFRKPEASA